MEWLDEIELYLQLKLQQRGKPSFGVRFLKRFPQIYTNRLQEYIQIAHLIISTQCETEGDKTGCKLTGTSISIGNQILQTVKSSKDEWDWKTAVKLGDLFIEGFYQKGYVDIVTNNFGSSKPTKVYLTDKWENKPVIPVLKKVLHGVWDEKPKDITERVEQVFSYKGGLEFTRPLVKRWDEEYKWLFDTVRDNEWVKSINKLQQVGWKVNAPVLEAIKNNRDKILQGNEDNLSKVIEYEYIIAKAEALKDDTFYCGIDVDYRGRLYYIESFFNFQSSDLAKGATLL